MNLPDIHSCSEHQVMLMADEQSDRREHCPVCEFDVDVNQEMAPDGLKPQEIRQYIEWETMVELLPIQSEYIDDQSDDEDDRYHGPYIAVAKLSDEYERPAGYTQTEVYRNVIVYRWGIYRKQMTLDHNALETIETLRARGYGE